ncbi:hypothetical protein BpHYR1_011899 [Brachionus plicatilis]|uniref:Uncharacterized protein n=1 Tax=Brachionus plicatilis TaxID=10195 RepID=A0A3M7RD00_BRAPC|nr:hypothetical protein BpHYR1_011899 [Brachionus plicatilis]
MDGGKTTGTSSHWNIGGSQLVVELSKFQGYDAFILNTYIIKKSRFRNINFTVDIILSTNFYILFRNYTYFNKTLGFILSLSLYYMNVFKGGLFFKNWLRINLCGDKNSKFQIIN